jgi:YVTN family beta-propeller protein
VSNDAYVINGLTNDVVKAIAVGRMPIGIAYDPANNSVYVGSANSTVSVINASTDNVVSTISLFSGAGHINFNFIAYSSINDALYVSRSVVTVVSVINTVTNAHVNDIVKGVRLMELPIILSTITYMSPA